LEQYVAGYRDRIRAAIEGDLAKLGGDVEPPSARPELHEVEMPAEREPVTAALVDEPEVEPPAPDAPESSGDGADWDSSAATRAITGPDAGASDPGSFASEASAVSPIVAPPRPEPAEWPPAPSADAATGPVPVVESSWLASDADWSASAPAWDAPAPWERE